MDAGSGAEVLNESDYVYLANELGCPRDVLMNRLTTRLGIESFKVDQLKKILGYLRQYKLFRQIPSYSGLKKIDLVELVHTFLHKYHAEAAQARASQPGAFPGDSYASNMNVAPMRFKWHEEAGGGGQLLPVVPPPMGAANQRMWTYEMRVNKATPNPFFNVHQTVLVKDIMSQGPQKITFELPQGWRNCIPGQDGTVIARLFEIPTAGQKVMKETAWINQGQLVVNDHPVAELPKRKKNHANNAKVNYTTRPTLLNGHVRSGTNVMRIMSMGERFCIMVQLGYFTSLSDMRERVINQSSNDPSASREKMMQSFQNSDDVACMEDELSLRCKISMARIRTPVKGLKCRHLQCFDLDTFLEFARRHSHWLCPNCDQPLCASDLRVDALFEQALVSVSPEADCCRVLPDGTFAEAKEKSKARNAAGGGAEANRSPSDSGAEFGAGQKRARDDSIPQFGYDFGGHDHGALFEEGEVDFLLDDSNSELVFGGASGASGYSSSSTGGSANGVGVGASSAGAANDSEVIIIDD